MLRLIGSAFVLTCTGAGVSAFVACSSNEEAGAESADAASAAEAGQGAEAASRADADAISDASVDANSDAKSDSACGAADGGVGGVCTANTQCACGTVCAALRCVPPSACDDALLTWDGTATLADGTCADGVAGYNVYWQGDAGPDADAGAPGMVDAGAPCRPSATLIACGDAGRTVALPSCAYRVQNLANATWTFSVTAYDDAGVESAPSVSASKTVLCP